MNRFVLLSLVLVGGCGGGQTAPAPTPGPPIETVSPVEQPASVCDAGNWVPRSQEPPHYVVCVEDDDCVTMVLRNCCSNTHVAIRRDRVCGSDFGSTCDMVCPETIPIHPEGAASMRAACVANTCTLVR